MSSTPPPAVPLPISVSMIAARDEAQNLSRALASVSGWVSECVVVVDDEDNPSAVAARGLGARVAAHPWRGHREARNISLGLATQPWVLGLDPDEEISPALRSDIEKFFARGDDARFTGAWFPRKVWFMGRWITHGDWYPDLNLRLFRRVSGRWVGGHAHERLELDGQAARFAGDLHHYSFPTLSSFVAKTNSTADATLRDLVASGKKFSAFNAAFRGAWRFFRCYVIRGGFLDGFPGFFVAAGVGFSTLVKHSRLLEHEIEKRGQSLPPRM